MGPEHAWLRDTGRATYRAVTDQQAMDAFLLLCRTEGIIPALESAHALAGALDIGRELGPDAIMLVNVSGRGDKDVDTAARWLHMTADAAGGTADAARYGAGPATRCRHRRGGNAAVNAVSAVFEKAAADGRAALVGYLPAGFPSVDGAIAAATAMAQAGADMIEIGLPYTDPLIDGPVIQEAVHRALTGGVRTVDVLRTVQALASAEVAVLVMTYWNPVDRYGVDAFARDLASAGGVGMITPDLNPEEAGPWLRAADTYGLDPVFVVAPSSTDERLAKVVSVCRGFVYAASVMGVTGARAVVSEAASGLVARVRAHTPLPVGVGLGVRDGAQAARVAQFADGVIVGSAFVQCLLGVQDAGAGIAAVTGLAADLARGVRAARKPAARSDDAPSVGDNG